MESYRSPNLKAGAFQGITREVTAIRAVSARPSDAIALAVWVGYSVFMARSVLAKTGYYPDDAAHDKKGAYEAYTLTEWEELLAKVITKEDYESAAFVRDATEHRGKA